jgi:1-acyl-sn-glycerol-3-phosphate acyltransferase
MDDKMAHRRIGFWARLAICLAKPPLAFFFRRDWRGAEHIPAAGGFIAAVNHNSYLDPISYGTFQYDAGRFPRFMAKSGLFKGVVGTILRGSGQIPVYRNSRKLSDAYRAAVAAVERGEGVVFYPEGTLTHDPDLWPMAGRTGVAQVALLTKVPVIPVAQWGAHLAVPPYATEKRVRLLPRKTLTVLAGPPVDLSRFEGREITAKLLREATETIMAAITELLSEIRAEPAPGAAPGAATDTDAGADSGE